MQQRMREAVLRILTASRTDVPLVVITPSPPDSLQLLLRKRQAGQRRVADRHLTLVAFTDPNDLLSYTLDESKYAQDGITVYNVLVSNAPTWLGLLERPDTAHLAYLSNPGRWPPDCLRPTNQQAMYA